MALENDNILFLESLCKTSSSTHITFIQGQRYEPKMPMKPRALLQSRAHNKLSSAKAYVQLECCKNWQPPMNTSGCHVHSLQYSTLLCVRREIGNLFKLNEKELRAALWKGAKKLTYPSPNCFWLQHWRLNPCPHHHLQLS